MPIRALFVALLALLPLYGQSDARTVRVFLFAGQSNMVGTHSRVQDVDRYPPFVGFAEPNPKVRYWYVLGREDKERSKGFVPLQPTGTYFGPELAFARRLQQSIDAPIAIVKVAAGGTTLGSDWNPEQPAGFQLYPLALETLRAATAELTRQKIPWRIEGVCWHQGENDMFEEPFRKNYEANLKGFIAAWRRDLGLPKLPFYLGELCTKTIWGMDNRDPMEAIATAQIAVAAADPDVEYIETSHIGVEIGGDNGLHYHYGTLGQLQHGVHYAERYLQRTAKLERPQRPLARWPYAKDADIDLYVFAGHRNMEGECAFVQDLHKAPSTKALAKDNPSVAFAYSLGGGVHRSSDFEPLGPAGLHSTFGPELSFAEALQKKSKAPLAILKFTHSGSQIIDWTPAGSSAPRRNLYPSFLRFIQEHIAALEAKGHRVRLRAIVYHLGENDMAWHPARREAIPRLAAIIAATRQDLKIPDLRWIVSQQTPPSGEDVKATDVVLALRDLAAKDEHLHVVEAFDPPPQPLALVFDTKAILWLGARQAAAALQHLR